MIEKLKAHTVIDLGCGTGLLTCELARRGYDMIGVEPSGPMLELAKRKPFAEKVKWIEGGYENFEGLKADLVLMTSHVAQFFLGDSEWQAMLEASYKALNPNGHIVFDSRQYIEKSFEKWPTSDTRKKVEDPSVGTIEWWCKLLEVKDRKARYELHYHFLNTGEEIVSTDELIFRTQEDLRTSLEKTGFSIKTIYGDWDRSPLSEASPEMIFVATRQMNNVSEFGIKRENEERRDGGCGIVYDPKTQKFAVGEEHATGLYRLFSGGVDKEEDIKEGVLREVREESGLYDFDRIEKVAEAYTHYRNDLRNVNRVAHATCFLITVNSTKTEEVHLEAHEKFSLVWVSGEELLKNWTERNQNHDMDHWFYFFEEAKKKTDL